LAILVTLFVLIKGRKDWQTLKADSGGSLPWFVSIPRGIMISLNTNGQSGVAPDISDSFPYQSARREYGHFHEVLKGRLPQREKLRTSHPLQHFLAQPGFNPICVTGRTLRCFSAGQISNPHDEGKTAPFRQVGLSGDSKLSTNH